jgi:hypothetical protein
MTRTSHHKWYSNLKNTIPTTRGQPACTMICTPENGGGLHRCVMLKYAQCQLLTLYCRKLSKMTYLGRQSSPLSCQRTRLNLPCSAIKAHIPCISRSGIFQRKSVGSHQHVLTCFSDTSQPQSWRTFPIKLPAGVWLQTFTIPA